MAGVDSRLPPLGLFGSLLIYGLGAALLYAATRIAIPLIVGATDAEPIVAWFIAAGFGVFLPLALVGAAIVAMEPKPAEDGWLPVRLWLRPISGADWAWTLGGAGVIAALTAPAIFSLVHSHGESSFTPEFMAFDPLTADRLWILAAWAPFFIVNMLGEGFIWHAVMLPRQARHFGDRAWLVSAAGWALFHIAMPWEIILSITPTVLVIPYLVQRRKNVWIGVVLHGLVNGPGFLAVAFGMV